MTDWTEEAVYVCPCKVYLVMEVEEDTTWLALNMHEPDIHAYFDTDEEAKTWVTTNHECI